MPRGRPVGSGAQGLEPCPDHPGSRVVKNGMYGKPGHRRQLYRCLPADGSKPHSFAGTAARLMIDHDQCDECENIVAAHQGPRVARRYDFPVTEAAKALEAVGRGMSYTEAADRTRVRSGRGRLVSGAQLVANWVEILGPVVCAEHAETSWPETVVLDSTWFMVTNTAMGTTSRAFAVLGAYGYPAGAAQGRTWALEARPRQRTQDWVEFCRRLPGEPALVVCDDDQAIATAVSKVWPNAYIAWCEHHLRAAVIKKMRMYGHASYGHPQMDLLNDAFHSIDGWDAFVAGATGIEVQAWIATHDAGIRDQISRRGELPAHYSTGAIEASLLQCREFMEPRAFCYRNAVRTNRMLELVRLRLNRHDDRSAYSRAIRAHLDANGGRLGRQLAIADPQGQPSLR